MASWPAGLPKPLFKGFGIVPNKRGRRFETDAGPAEQDLATTAGLRRVTLVYAGTPEDASTILSFWGGDGACGGTWFDFPQPFTGVMLNARFIVGVEPATNEVNSVLHATVVLEVDGW